jgi:regulator of protease activity HflC (stomatin/prohibitin superfamily)
MSLQFSESSKSEQSNPLLVGEVINNSTTKPGEFTMSRLSTPRRNGLKVANVRQQDVPLVAKCCSLICCPLAFMGTAYTVDQQTEAAVLHLGVLTHIERTPGLHFTWPCFREVKTISTKHRTVSLPSMKVADQSGAPILVSAILNYYVEDAKQAIFNVENFNSYVLNNAEAVLKQVVGRYSYYQLKSETEQINQAMLDTITPLVRVAGAKVTSMLLNELNYAPEVASGMLKTQQAGALLEARTIIVEGAVKIALDAVKMLEQSGLKMTEEGKSKMVSNLLTVSVSDVDATPTISMS